MWVPQVQFLKRSAQKYVTVLTCRLRRQEVLLRVGGLGAGLHRVGPISLNHVSWQEMRLVRACDHVAHSVLGLLHILRWLSEHYLLAWVQVEELGAVASLCITRCILWSCLLMAFFITPASSLALRQVWRLWVNWRAWQLLIHCTRFSIPALRATFVRALRSHKLGWAGWDSSSSALTTTSLWVQSICSENSNFRPKSIVWPSCALSWVSSWTW